MYDDRPELSFNPEDEPTPPSHSQYTARVRELIEDAFRHSNLTGQKGNLIEISEGVVTTPTGDVTLIRECHKPQVAYIVRCDAPRPSECLYHIDVTTGETYNPDSIVPNDAKSVANFLEQLIHAAEAPYRAARARRGRAAKGIGITLGVITVAGGALVGIGVALWPTSEPIRSERIYTTDNRAQDVEWSDQYKDEIVWEFQDDPSDEVSTDSPHKMTAPFGSVLDQCDVHESDIREGQKFRVVYFGQKGDSFTIRFDHINDEFEVCRTGSEGALSEEDDIIFIQRIAE
ncbi:MAG TPA: hypothetical protein VFT59_01070 [Candidatus Saccharimonadales bacterium]|nr:hypothetical protein [Candidatus Saccharimonadales bacterium]